MDSIDIVSIEPSVSLLVSNLGDYSLTTNVVDIAGILNKAATKALNGGTAGASAAAIQVVSLMWLRTAINYQYRYGMNTTTALKDLYAQGGIGRLYQGLPFAIVQGPLSRFGDTAANALIFSLFESIDPGGSVYPIILRTAVGSLSAGCWRVVLMPIDTAKTVLQVQGKGGFSELSARAQAKGPLVLFDGALASSAATFVGHFPWFLTFNYLTAHLPTAETSASTYALLASCDPRILDLARSAFIGLCASSISDVSSNSLRVLKTARQTAFISGNVASNSTSDGSDGSRDGSDSSDGSSGGSKSTTSGTDKDVSYLSLARQITEADGWGALLGRGLQTRLLSNALQGMLFSVLFKYFSNKH